MPPARRTLHRPPGAVDCSCNVRGAGMGHAPTVATARGDRRPPVAEAGARPQVRRGRCARQSRRRPPVVRLSSKLARRMPPSTTAEYKILEDGILHRRLPAVAARAAARRRRPGPRSGRLLVRSPRPFARARVARRPAAAHQSRRRPRRHGGAVAATARAARGAGSADSATRRHQGRAGRRRRSARRRPPAVTAVAPPTLGRLRPQSGARDDAAPTAHEAQHDGTHRRRRLSMLTPPTMDASDDAVAEPAEAEAELSVAAARRTAHRPRMGGARPQRPPCPETQPPAQAVPFVAQTITNTLYAPHTRRRSRLHLHSCVMMPFAPATPPRRQLA